MATNSLSSSLRRSANRSAGPRGRAPSQRLRDAADAGLLTRSNTRAGTAGRRAADAAEYERRIARHPGVSARQAAGHIPAGAEEKRLSAIFRSVGFAVVVGAGRADRRRLARYDSLVGQLRGGSLSGAAFRRRVRGWQPYGAEGLRFEWDPDVVLALLAERDALGEDLFVYEDAAA